MSFVQRNIYIDQIEVTLQPFQLSMKWVYLLTRKLNAVNK